MRLSRILSAVAVAWLTGCAAQAGSRTSSRSLPSSSTDRACLHPGDEILFQRVDSDRSLDLYLYTPHATVRRLTQFGAWEGRWSPDGKRIAFSSMRDATQAEQTSNTSTGSEIYVMNADGSDVRRLTNNHYYDGVPTWSPDGHFIAFVATPDAPADEPVSAWAARRQIFVMRDDGSDVHRLTSSPMGNNFPAWSPDGRLIAFSSARDNVGAAQVYVMNANGSEQQRLTHSAVEETYPAWSNDGQRIAFISKAQDSLSDIHTMNPRGSQVVNVTATPGFDGFPSWSPDGRCIAYSHHGVARSPTNLFVRAIDGSRPDSLDVLGTRPAWRPKSNGLIH